MVDQRWHFYGAGPADRDRFKYGYDRASTRVWRENVVGPDRDELYGYDGLHRLVDMKRGTLTAQKDAVMDLRFRHQWELSALGNWSIFREDADGNETWDINQTIKIEAAGAPRRGNDRQTLSSPATGRQSNCLLRLW